MKRLYRSLCRIEEVLGGVCLMVCMLSLFVGAILRTMGKPLIFSFDVALFAMAWSVFLGADVAYRNHGLMAADILVNQFRGKAKFAVALFTYAIAFVFLAMMTYCGTLLCVKSWIRPIPSIPSVSYGYVALSIPVGCFLLFITNILHVAALFKEDDSAEGEKIEC